MTLPRIILIIEYMNAIYALKQMDNHFYPATSSFGIRILSSDICILYDIRLLVPWLCGRVIQMCFALYSGSRLYCFYRAIIKQFDFSVISPFPKSQFWRKSWKRLCIHL
jgi:hypothetical protein